MHERKGFGYGLFHWLWCIFLTSFFSFLYFIFYTALLMYLLMLSAFRADFLQLLQSFIKTFVTAKNLERFSLYFVHIEQTNFPFSIFNHWHWFCHLSSVFFFGIVLSIYLSCISKKLTFNISLFIIKRKSFECFHLSILLLYLIECFIFTNLFIRMFYFHLSRHTYVPLIHVKSNNIYLEEVKLSLNN